MSEMMTTPTYTPKQLLSSIAVLPAITPIAVMIAPPKVYDSHKDHWMGWLQEYDGPGYYNRKHSDRDAAFIFNHVQNVGMIVWIAEAVGADRGRVEHAYRRTLHAAGNSASRTALARRFLPWPMVAKALFPK